MHLSRLTKVTLTGYLDDAFVQGVFPGLSSGTSSSISEENDKNSRNSLMVAAGQITSPSEDPVQAEACSTGPHVGPSPPYVFQHWSRTSIFVYFSHERFTIPPVTWTQAAHQNGVRILGTFITEWEPGKLENERWILGIEPDDEKSRDESRDASKHPVRWNHRYADRMVQLAVEYGFDGWFINVESELAGTRCTPEDLKAFLRYLTQKMHLTKPNSLVLWYDSLTNEGSTTTWWVHGSLYNRYN